MKAVFLDQKTFSSNIDFTAIAAQVTSLQGHDFTEPEQVVARCQNSEIIISNKVVLTGEIMAQLPALQLVCVAATGTNNVDIHAASELGITVCNVRDYAQNAVAQYVFAQLLEHFQHTSAHNRNTRQGLWSKGKSFCLHGAAIDELAGKTIAIIGCGSLGQAVARIAEAFGMTVLPGEHRGAAVVRPGRVSFEQALQRADVISLHCPLTEATEKLIAKETLALCKHDALLINTARGALINNADLLDALQNQRLGAAILDVLDQEPPPADHPLLHAQLDNLKITGHIAWASTQAQQRLVQELAQNIAAFKRGDRRNLVTS